MASEDVPDGTMPVKMEDLPPTGDGLAVTDGASTANATEPSTDGSTHYVKTDPEHSDKDTASFAESSIENSKNPVKAEPGLTDKSQSVTPAEPTRDGKANVPANVEKPNKEISLKSVRDVADSDDLAIVEAGVKEAIKLLDQLRIPMADFKENQELAIFLKSIDSLRVKAKTVGRTVIAVAGATGAGKSSFINAVLNEEKLLPTNGMRACTAAITEISFNDDTDPSRAYRAVVDFISPKEWHEEVVLLYNELTEDNQQLSPDIRDANSEAGVAYAKVKSVYHDMTNDMLAKSNPDELATNDTIIGYLGTQKHFAFETAAELHSALSIYLDSKEKSAKTGRLVPGMSLWPIIRSVRIFTRADALSTGVCLVDLPGTLDSNAARSAVASKYMAECTAVWVASRISRAVDDKAAKDLLGRSSRIQLKLDGALSHVSFIATQTDCINFEETIDAMDEDGQIQAMLAREDDLTAEIAARGEEVQSMNDRLKTLEEEQNALDSELSTWQVLKRKRRKGKIVYAPEAPPMRAKCRRTARQQAMESSEDDDYDKEPLTEGEISAKLDLLKAAIDARHAEISATEEQAEAAKQSRKLLQQEKADISIHSASTCIRMRNDYCRSAIRSDFASGIREIDEEDGQDSDDYDPTVPKRNYEDVARSFPVFCISSKAYQQFRKPTSREVRVKGFKTIEDSEIPSLREHAKMASQSGQLRFGKAFLNQLSSLFNSLNIWTTTNELSLSFGKAGIPGAGYEGDYLKVQTEKLQEALVNDILSLKGELLNIGRGITGHNSSTNIKHASKNVVSIVFKWHHIEEVGGYGLKYSTYRAICRRGGEKTPCVRARNFNEDLMEAYLLKISGPWEQMFTKTIPAKLSSFADTAIKLFRDFHSSMMSRAETHNVRVATLRILGRQLQTHEAAIMDAITAAKIQLTSAQREASRLLVPQMKDQMKELYAKNAGERGEGCYNRMKESTVYFLKNNRVRLFTNIEKKVDEAVVEAIKSVVKTLAGECEQIRVKMEHDYKFALNSSKKIEVDAVVRERVREILCETDTIFDGIVTTFPTPMDIDSISDGQPVEPGVSGSSVGAPAGVVDTVA